MTFENALKIIADRNPEKFEYTDNSCGTTMFQIRGGDGALTACVTQDFLDGILCLIGWAYDVQFKWQTEEDAAVITLMPKRYFWTLYKEVERPNFYRTQIDWLSEHDYPTKIEAAKGALIAIAQELFWEKPTVAV